MTTGSPCARRIENRALGEELRSFVVPDHGIERDRRRLIAGCAVGRYADRRDAGGVDDCAPRPRAAPPPGYCACPRRWSDTAAAGRVRRADSPRRRETAPRNRRPRGSSEAGSLRSPTAISSGRLSRLLRSEPARTSARTCQPVAQQRPRHRGADESGGARDQCPHAGRSPRKWHGSTVARACPGRRPRRSELNADAIAPRQAQERGDLQAVSAADRGSAGRCALARAARCAATACGMPSRAVSTITRTAMKGTPWAAATCATAELSMSTAQAPVARRAALFVGRGIERVLGREQRVHCRRGGRRRRRTRATRARDARSRDGCRPGR